MGNRKGRQGTELTLLCLHAVSSSDQDLDIICEELGFSKQTVRDAYPGMSACNKCHMKEQALNSCQKRMYVA